MSRVEELEKAVDTLSDDEYDQFRQWFLMRDWEKWDREIEEDSKTGKLDFLFDEVAEAKKKNALRDL